MSSTYPVRLVLHCDESGGVQRTEGAAGVFGSARAGFDRLPLLVDSASAAKCERFLERVRAGAAFGWELHIATDHGAMMLLFAGLRRSPTRLLVTAADTADGLLLLLDESLNGASANVRDERLEVRGAALAAGEVQVRPPSANTVHGNSAAALDEMSRVNSDLVSLQRELAKRNAELSAITKQRNELLAVAAHDLRNPILLVQGYCDLLGLTTGPERSSQRELLEQVQRASELMMRVIEDTLEYARLEAGKIPTRLGDVDLAEVLRATCESYRSMAEHKQIALIVSCAGTVPPLALDATHMEQVVGNLLSNAIKFSNVGGRIELRLARSADEAILTVQDHGLGIDPAEVPLLFRPFQTTSTRPTNGEPSTGLGLAIVRKLVEANRGRIAVRSALQEGSTFEVRFPIDGRREDEPTRNVHADGGASLRRPRTGN